MQQAYECARHVGLLLLSVIKLELGNLDRVKRVIKVMGLVNAAPGFSNFPEVINGCSDLFVDVFAERGQHARTSFGVALPYEIPVEIEAIIEIDE